MSGLPQPTATLWFVHYQGQRLGPYHWEQVAKYYADCGSPADFLVWTDGRTAWVAMASLIQEAASDESLDLPQSPQLSIGLRDQRQLDVTARAGVRSTGKTAIVEAAEVAQPKNESVESNSTALDGWVNASAPAQPEVTEPEKPLEAEFTYRMPQVKPKPPLYVTIVLIAACALTHALHVPGFQMPVPKSPFTLRCFYRVETLGNSSIRQTVKVQVAGNKFRTSTPQLLKAFALFDGKHLAVFEVDRTAKKTDSVPYKKTEHVRPNPKLMADIMLWTPRVHGEPVGSAKVAGRMTRKLSEITRMGSQVTQVEEWIDAEQGIVLKRLETTREKTAVLEKKVFQCSRLNLGPVTRGAFKEPT